MKHVHLIGIGGSGLSAIARVLLERGIRVSGSDRQPSALLEALQVAGAHVFTGHQPENIIGADLVVRSSAVQDANPEVQAALKAGIPVLKRSEFLGRVLQGDQVIGVAGTHGKTTTTAMISWMLDTLGLEPSFIIGGVARDFGTNARSGNGRHFVIEADEYDRMFLGLNPQIAVVTNIEHDHPDCYPTPQDFYQAFLDYVGRLQPDGVLCACLDDPGARQLLDDARLQGIQTRSYGQNHWLGSTGPDFAALNPTPNASGGFTFEVSVPGSNKNGSRVEVALQVPGRHNVSNALAALSVAGVLGLSMLDAAAALGGFGGVGRRFEVRGEVKGITIVDDYAHHPSEIRATLAAARARYPGRRIWAAWQPHTYSRIRSLFDEFASAFDDADRVLVTPIYAARETAPADGFSSETLVAALRHSHGIFQPGLSHTVDYLVKELRPQDVLLVLSAGDADQISTELLERMKG